MTEVARRYSNRDSVKDDDVRSVDAHSGCRTRRNKSRAGRKSNNGWGGGIDSYWRPVCADPLKSPWHKPPVVVHTQPANIQK